jgi:hypothetical protein
LGSRTLGDNKITALRLGLTLHDLTESTAPVAGFAGG